MAFTLETPKSGTPHVLLRKYKYRESYAVKNGDIVWRCLERSCNATIKTDIEKAVLILTHNRHFGPHPVTMRSLQLPPQLKPGSPP